RDPVYSCLTLAVACAGRAVETIEGLSTERGLHPVQEGFIEHDAFQCGFCTPGQIMSCVGLLRRNPSPTTEDVLRAVSGNLCRCGAVPNIVAAALSERKKQARRGASRSSARSPSSRAGSPRNPCSSRERISRPGRPRPD